MTITPKYARTRQPMTIVGRLCRATIVVVPAIFIANSAVAQNAPSTAPPAASPDLQKRVEQLEEQLVDIQVVIGTLDSLARGAGGAPAPQTGGGLGAGFSDGGAATDGRIAGLETQIRALTAQLEQLSRQVQSLQSGQAAPAIASPAVQAPQDLLPPAGGPTGFGSTTVTPQSNDPITGYLEQGGSPQNQGQGGATNPPTEVAAIGPQAGAGGNPKELYERAYGFLLQQNYGAAQTAFSDFLKNHPNDSLAGNAQYWLGESYYVTGNYRIALEAFRDVMNRFPDSPKAPHAKLKIGYSHFNLQEWPEAERELKEVSARYPNDSVARLAEIQLRTMRIQGHIQ